MKKLLIALLFLATPAFAERLHGNITKVCVAITPDTSAYAAGDIVGGLQTFAGIFAPNVNSGTIVGAEVSNTEIDGNSWLVCTFATNPAGSTVADQGAPTIVAADLQKIKCFGVTQGKAFATTEMFWNDAVNTWIDGASPSLYAILITNAAPTWAAAQTVNLCLTVLNG